MQGGHCAAAGEARRPPPGGARPLQQVHKLAARGLTLSRDPPTPSVRLGGGASERAAGWHALMGGRQAAPPPIKVRCTASSSWPPPVSSWTLQAPRRSCNAHPTARCMEATGAELQARRGRRQAHTRTGARALTAVSTAVRCLTRLHYRPGCFSARVSRREGQVQRDGRGG